MNRNELKQMKRLKHCRNRGRSVARAGSVLFGVLLLGACSPSSRSASTNSASANPVTSKSVTTESVTTESVATEPVTTEPVPTKPIAETKLAPDTTAVPTQTIVSSATTKTQATLNSPTRSDGGVVLPVEANPIRNTATAPTLKIESVLVENNVDEAGKATDDHLEITLSNSRPTDLRGIEIFYTFSDPTSNTTENYYTKLPDNFVIPANGKRVAHFDATGQPDHFPVNKFSLYYTDKNELEVKVIASAQGAAVQTTKLKKDAGGAEAAD